MDCAIVQKEWVFLMVNVNPVLILTVSHVLMRLHNVKLANQHIKYIKINVYVNKGSFYLEINVNASKELVLKMVHV